MGSDRVSPAAGALPDRDAVLADDEQAARRAALRALAELIGREVFY